MNFSDLPDWALLAILCALAALWIGLRALFKSRTGARKPAPKPVRPQRHRPPHAPRKRPWKTLVLVDGSNVIHWRMNEGLDLAPSLAPLLDVIAQLKADNIGAGVIFDATAGYKLHDRFIGHDEFAMMIPDAEDIFVVPKGTNADDYLIDMAMHENLRIISNDRFRDHPNAKRVTKQRGEIVNGQIRLAQPRK
ncbi:hypothetical protein [Albirhodobacter sp. R86504]|uniref:NYN domain-containing protein n=1 Tax=Albirhodobacter sp. R86504 TaxID=3093848 RepID=UPI00366B817E